ncbi:MAG: N-methyl-L-tryptophan oxidase [Maricaulis sp.]|uniref:N-methyl-L-tryptophan oxidase n=1 Tax=Maricaulis sp. TaxID=1486257 RepID=UPI001B18C27B|nr:N-methyl-L-tryptophan oxidase [Maricaulis sp.]MBO6730780.1 N-methyl-L-tryptophan oxidase [Maricaulis sp.]MBO6848061.1 N-methyl-L-tryptophan oxidase [Maricaulis sp.]MBO6878036.1 N-methyl-L-tryptophan oxidase [Maricaulis sp.]
MTVDIGIIGLGAMGSAAAWSLALRGATVLGVDRHPLGHALGSSHGKTRIIRSVYSEGNIYDALVDEAYAGWDRLEREFGQAFFRKTGGLDISVRADGIFQEALAAAKTSGKPFEVLEGQAIEQRFPALDLNGRGRAVYNADAGLLDSDEASAWMRADAIRRGADLRGETPVAGWQRVSDGFILKAGDEEITCRKLIMAAGAWCGALVPALQPVLVPERQVIAWYRADGASYDSLPIFQLETDTAERFYVFPPHRGQGLKAGLYNHRRERGAAHIAPRGVDEDDLALLAAGLSDCLPGVDQTPLETAECRFTLAPGDRFIMGCMPDDKDLVLLSPCSGHGYKFVPAIGEIAADLALEKDPAVDLAPFSVERVLS